MDYYPPGLRGQGIGGTSLVWLLVDSTGVVRARQIKRSSGNPELDAAALRIAAEMLFRPARDAAGPLMA